MRVPPVPLPYCRGDYCNRKGRTVNLCVWSSTHRPHSLSTSSARIPCDRASVDMRAIIIGAGRGSRLMPTTENAPKCFAEIQGKRILDWTVDALRGGGCNEICFIGGYLLDAARAAHRQLI